MEINIWYIFAGLFYLVHGYIFVKAMIDQAGEHEPKVMILFLVIIWPLFSIAFIISDLFQE